MKRTRMKKRLALWPAIVLAAAVMCGSFCALFGAGTAKADDDVIEISVEVTYYQTEARTVTDLINQLRAGEDAWAWESDNVNKKWYNDRGPIQYDYALEQIAMQRAAEAAFYFSHDRPNGKSCFSVEYNGTHAWGENLGLGYYSAEDMFEGWCESNSDFSGQGHRRLLLGQAYVGISHVMANGQHYWAAAFSGTGSNAPETPAFDGVMIRTFDVDIDFVGERHRRFDINYDKEAISIYVWCSESTNLPATTFYRYYYYEQQKWLGEATLEKMILPQDKYNVSWSIDDPGIAEIVDNRIIGKTEGETRLRASVEYLGETFSNEVVLYVKERDLNKASVFVEAVEFNSEGPPAETVLKDPSNGTDYQVQPLHDFEYTGEPITIVFALFYQGNSLKSGKDYEIIYENNTEPGTATVYINGIGDYKGQLTYSFQIVKKDPTPTPTLTPSPEITETPTPTPTGEVTVIPSEEVTPEPTKEPEPTVTPKATPEPTGAENVTPFFSPTPTPTPTEEPILSATPVLSPTQPIPEEHNITEKTETGVKRGPRFPWWTYLVVLLALIVVIVILMMV